MQGQSFLENEVRGTLPQCEQLKLFAQSIGDYFSGNAVLRIASLSMSDTSDVQQKNQFQADMFLS